MAVTVAMEAKEAAAAAVEAVAAMQAVTWMAAAAPVPRGGAVKQATMRMVVVPAMEAAVRAVAARVMAAAATEARREVAEAAVASRLAAQEENWVVLAVGLVVAGQVMLRRRPPREITRSGSPAPCTRPPSCQRTENGASSRCFRGCR